MTDKLRLGLQFFARDLGPAGNDDIELDWAYGDYRFKDYLGIRIGLLKLVNGMYSEVRDLDMTRTGILLPQGVYPELWRDTFSSIRGVGLYGGTPSVMGTFSYDFQAGALNLSKDSGFAVGFEDNFSALDLDVSEMDSDISYMAGLEWQPSFAEGLRLKGTYYDIENMTVTGDAVVSVAVGVTLSTTLDYRVNEFNGYVLSAEYMMGELTLAGEYATGDFRGDYRINLSTTESPWTPRPAIKTEGWYLSGAYRFTDMIEWGLGYSHYYPDKNDKDGDNQQYDFLAWEKDLFSSFRFDLNAYTILKLEVHDMNGFGAYSTTQDPSVKPEEDWYLFAAKITFSF